MSSPGDKYTALEAFLKTCEELSTLNDAGDIALCVMDKICTILNAERASFFFVCGDCLQLVLAKGVENIQLPLGHGFAGECASTGKVMNIPDAYANPKFDPKFDKENDFKTKQVLVAPVTDREGKHVGVLQAINHIGDTDFTQKHELMIKYMAGHVGTVLSDVMKANQLVHDKKRLYAFIDCLKSLESNRELGSASSITFSLNRAAEQITSCDRVTIFSVNQENQTMGIVETNNNLSMTFPIGTGIAGTVAETGKALNIQDAQNDDRFNSDNDKKTGYCTRNMLVVPMVDTAGKVRGVLQMINKDEMVNEGNFTEDDQELMGILLQTSLPMLSQTGLFNYTYSAKKEAHARY